MGTACCSENEKFFGSLAKAMRMRMLMMPCRAYNTIQKLIQNRNDLKLQQEMISQTS